MTELQRSLFDDPPAYVGRVSKHPAYRVWKSLITRCTNSNDPSFRGYGQRGITVCDEWRASSRAFIAWALVNGWEPGLQLDRRDNEGPYSPANCRFVTPSVNNLNRRDTVRLSNGRAAWPHAQRNGVSRTTFNNRRLRGWTPEQAAGIAPPPVRHQKGAGLAQPGSPAVTETATTPSAGVVMPEKPQGGCSARSAVRVALGESAASAQGDKAQRPAFPAGLVDLPHVDLPRPLPSPGSPAGSAKELKND